MKTETVVLCDLDGIVADLLTTWLVRYNTATGYNFTKADITDFEIASCLPKDTGIYDHLRRDGIFRDLKPLPGAVESLKWFNDVCELYIVSTPSRNPNSAAEKLEWCRHHLPFLPRQKIILTGAKRLIQGDVLIDDSPEHLNLFPRKTITIDYPYNRNCKRVNFRAMDYTDTAKAWTEIMGYFIASELP